MFRLTQLGYGGLDEKRTEFNSPTVDASVTVSRFFAVMLAVATLDAVSPAQAASALSAPIEELNARFVEVMKAGKTLQFHQRYTLLAPTSYTPLI